MTLPSHQVYSEQWPSWCTNIPLDRSCKPTDLLHLGSQWLLRSRRKPWRQWHQLSKRSQQDKGHSNLGQVLLLHL